MAAAPPSSRPNWLRIAVSAALRPYFAVWHHFAVTGRENLPPTGPLLALFNHCSLLDPLALLLVDPYPRIRVFAKTSLFGVPVVGWFVREMGGVPVERQGRDLSGVRVALQGLRQGDILAIAAEGRRSRSGRLETINPVLARLAAIADVPILPLGVVGTCAALPPGAILPRRRPIAVHIGATFRLPRGTPAPEAQHRISQAIAALLPPEQQPLAVGA